MPFFMTAGTVLECSFGAAPCPMIVMPLPGLPSVMGLPAATIENVTPENIPTFGMCSSMANPEVASATAAAQGVLTPMPCVPVVVSPWVPPATSASYEGVPLATQDAKCECAFGGTISVAAVPQMNMEG